MRLMLHDDYGMSQASDMIPVYPPIKWDEFRPNTRKEILNHYYAYSSGCQKPTLFGGLALAAAGVASAGFGTAALAGAKAALIGIKTKAISGTASVIGAQSADLISKTVEDSAKKSADKAGNTARQTARRMTDSDAEKDRIVDTYTREYNQMASKGFQNNVAKLTLSELKTKLVAAQNSVKVAEGKCKKLPCDTAGCRNMGVLNARVQYLQALIKTYEGSGTSTPAEYNAKFTDKALTGKTSMGGFFSGMGLPALIIGGLILSRLKK